MNYTNYYADTGRAFYKEEVADAVKKYATVAKSYKTIQVYKTSADHCKDIKDAQNIM